MYDPDLTPAADARPRVAENDLDLCARQAERFFGALSEEGAVTKFRQMIAHNEGARVSAQEPQ